MKVSIISHNLSENPLGRAHVLADLLNHYFEVEVLGPKLSGDIWKPVSEKREYKILPIEESLPKFFGGLNKSIKEIGGDVVIAVKPKGTSFGLAIANKIINGTPVILDTDDWETSNLYESENWLLEFLKSVPEVYYVNSINWSFLSELGSVFADEKLVSNSFLQDRLGGSIIPHARNTEKFSPDLFKQGKIRSELELPKEKTIVMFSGTPRPHKGVDDLIRAVNSLESSEVVAVIVGVHNSVYVNELKRIAGKRVKFYGKQPFEDIPKWIAAADIIVVPQKQTMANRGQIPAKVFDAMAMAKPTIATEMCDLPHVLDGCGIIVDPESPRAIADAIKSLHVNSEKCKALGAAARKRCVRHFSYKAVAPKLREVIIRSVD